MAQRADPPTALPFRDKALLLYQAQHKMLLTLQLCLWPRSPGRSQKLACRECTSHERGFQQPPVLLRKSARLSASVADLVIAVHPDPAGINLGQRQLQSWRAPLQRKVSASSTTWEQCNASRDR